MRRITNHRGMVISLIIIALIGSVVFLIARSGAQAEAVKPFNLTAQGAVAGIPCGNVRETSNVVSKLAAGEKTGKRNEEAAKWGLTSEGVADNAKIEKARTELHNRAESCTPGKTTISLADGIAGVIDSDGDKRVSVPLVSAVADTTPSASTVGDSNTPASLVQPGNPVRGWDGLAARVQEANAPWYQAEVEARKSKTGFGWDQVANWGSARTPEGKLVDSRVIVVYGNGITEDEARHRARTLIGDVANELPIQVQPHCFMNTRGFGGKQLEDFLYCPPAQRQVRVTLAKLVQNELGQVTGLDASSGVFVDCLNIWWIPRAVNLDTPQPPKSVPPTTMPPGTSPPRTIPPRTVPPTTPPTTGLTPKDPSKMLNPPIQHSPAPAPPASDAERVPPPGAQIVQPDGTRETVKPANPSTPVAAPTPGITAPGAKPTPITSAPAPTVTQAPKPVSPGTPIGNPDA